MKKIGTIENNYHIYQKSVHTFLIQFEIGEHTISFEDFKFCEWMSEETNCFRATLVVDGKKIDVASFVDVEKLPVATRESLENEVEAAFAMYREEFAEEKFSKALTELSEEEVKALDEAIPFKVELQADDQKAEE